MEHEFDNFKMQEGYLVLADVILEKLGEWRKRRQEKKQASGNTGIKTVRPLTSN